MIGIKKCKELEMYVESTRCTKTQNFIKNVKLIKNKTPFKFIQTDNQKKMLQKTITEYQKLKKEFNIVAVQGEAVNVDTQRFTKAVNNWLKIEAIS